MTAPLKHYPVVASDTLRLASDERLSTDVMMISFVVNTTAPEHQKWGFFVEEPHCVSSVILEKL